MTTPDLPSAPRPHMVVMVDNPVIGDSRMLKTADSAHNAGYDVTLLGLAKRTPPAGRHGPVPLYRVTVAPDRHKGHQARLAYRERVPGMLPASPWPTTSPVASPGRLAARGVRAVGRRTGLPAGAAARWLERPRLSRELRQRLEFLHDGPLDAETTRTAAAEWTPDVLVDGRYRWLWPHMEDVEQAFVEALLDLDPDLIHAADRFCLVAADTYARVRQAAGRPVPWIYDAHEWIPGQTLHGGPYAKTAWLAAEHELSPRADAVIAVSEELADRMQTRHGLDARPTVVVNAPVSARVPMDPADRRPLREEVGLGEDVPLLVYVGKLSELRGVLTVVRALPMLPGVHAAFVGSPDVHMRGQLVELAESLGVAGRLHLLDYVPAASVTWYISSADIGLSPLLPTAAHHAALPTKIRECLHAGLPLVVSDMRAQGAFVHEHALGAVHRPDDEHSLAEAVRTVLEDLPGYRAALTDELLLEHTWEGQEVRLVELWTSLVAPSAPGPDDVLPGERAEDRQIPWHDPRALGLVGPSDAVSTALREALVAEARPVSDIGASSGAGSDVSAPTGQIRAALDRWLHLQDGPRRLIYTSPAPQLPLFHPTLPQEVDALRATGHQVAVLLDPLTHVRPADLFAAVPGHPLSERPEEISARYARQVRRNRRQLQELNAPLLTTGLNAAGLLPGATWLPFPVVCPPLRRTGRRTLRVLVSPGTRSEADLRAVESWAARSGGGTVSVTRPTDLASVDPSLLAAHDVLVDVLSTGEHTPLAAQALAHGLVVVTGTRSTVAERVLGNHLESLGIGRDLVDLVLVTARPGDLDRVLSEVLSGLEAEGPAVSDTAHRAQQLAERLHGPASAELAIKDAFTQTFD